MENFDRELYQRILRLWVPLFLQQVLRISVDTINSIMLGGIDQIQMSALAQANQVFFIYFTVCSGLSAGCTVLAAQYWGKQDVERIPVIVSQALRTVFVLGLAATALVFLFPEWFMRIYSSDPEIIAIGAVYMRRVSLTYIACGLSLVIFGACRGVEQVKLILFTNLISYSINILLDYLLIYGRFGFPAMGLTGVAIGTNAARLAELVICALLFFTRSGIPFTAGNLLKTDPTIRASFLKVSAPIIAHELIWSLGTSSGAMITGQLGKSAVAGYNVTQVLYDIGTTVGHGYLSACSVVIGMILGSGDRERAKKAAASMIRTGICIGVVLGIVTFLVRPLFLRLYTLDPEARAYAMQFMTIIAFIWPFSLIEMTTIVAILRAGGDGKTGFYTDIVAMWMICIPLAALAAFRLHAEPWVVVLIIKLIIVIESSVGLVRVFQYGWLRNLTAGDDTRKSEAC